MRPSGLRGTLAVTLLLCPGVLPGGAPACRAGIIPIQEEFVLVQSVFVDTSLDAVFLFLLEKNGSLDRSAVITYQSVFTVTLDPNGVPSGTFAGTYGGTYNGLTVSGVDTGDLTQVGTDLVFTGPSEIEIDGEKYKNNLKFTEKSDNKGSLEGEVEDKDGNKKSISGPDLEKEKKDGKLKLKGKVTIGGHKENLTFELDQQTGKFTSRIKSFPFIDKKNQGDFGPLKDPPVGGSQSYKMDLRLSQAVPAPGGVLLAAAAAPAFALHRLLRRRAA